MIPLMLVLGLGLVLIARYQISDVRKKIQDTGYKLLKKLEVRLQKSDFRDQKSQLIAQNPELRTQNPKLQTKNYNLVASSILYLLALFLLSIGSITSNFTRDVKIENYHPIYETIIKSTLNVSADSPNVEASQAIFGNFYRDQGLIFFIIIFTFLFLFAFFINYQNIFILFLGILISALHQANLGIQKYRELYAASSDHSVPENSIFGNFGQPNWYAGHLVIGLVAGLFFLEVIFRNREKLSYRIQDIGYKLWNIVYKLFKLTSPVSDKSETPSPLMERESIKSNHQQADIRHQTSQFTTHNSQPKTHYSLLTTYHSLVAYCILYLLCSITLLSIATTLTAIYFSGSNWGIITAIIILFFFFIKQLLSAKKFKNFLIFSLIFFICLSFPFVYALGHYEPSEKPNILEKSISKIIGNQENQLHRSNIISGTIDYYILNKTDKELVVYAKDLLFGSGFDTLGENLMKLDGSIKNSYNDRAHNIIFDILAFTGISGLILFSLALFLIYKYIDANSNFEQYILFGVVAVIIRTLIHEYSATNTFDLLIILTMGLGIVWKKSRVNSSVPTGHPL